MFQHVSLPAQYWQVLHTITSIFLKLLPMFTCECECECECLHIRKKCDAITSTWTKPHTDSKNQYWGQNGKVGQQINKPREREKQEKKNNNK